MKLSLENLIFAMIITLRKTFGNALAFAKTCTFALLLVLAPSLWAQDFSVTAVPTNETCEGNGTLTLSVENAEPGAVINYTVYALPNTTTPVWNSPNPLVTGQQSGNYLVEATQSVGGDQVGPAATLEVQIANEVTSLVFTFTGDNAMCGPDGSITVNVLEGNPIAYEIVSGPVTVPSQPSNVFSGIPAGFYNIKVYDNCGSQPVQAFTLGSDGPVPDISDIVFPDKELPDCDHLTVRGTIEQTTNVPLAFPITCTFTVYPPDGGPAETFTQVVTADPDPGPGFPVSDIIPLYYGEDYEVELTIIDPCGVPLTYGPVPVEAAFFASIAFNDVYCGDYEMTFDPTKFTYPLTIEFTDVPDDFDPEEFNAGHPGPFNAIPVIYGGEGNSVPYGIYTYTITDGCGHTYTATGNHEEPTNEVEPFPTPTPAGCDTGLGSVQIIVAGKMIVSAVITEAPDAYPNELDDEIIDDANVTIDPVNFILEYTQIPPGDYVIVITDECGTVYDPVSFTVQGPLQAEIKANSRPDCEENMGTLRIYSNIGEQPLTSLSVVAAPAAFNQALPYDISGYITDDGSAYMDGLPPGTYKFDGVASCTPNMAVSIPYVVTGYSESVNDVSEIPHCGSFDVSLFHTSTPVQSQKFAIQVQDPDTGEWKNPETGEVYVEGSAIGNNDIDLTNNFVNLNFTYPSGTYRILKTYESFANGSAGGKKKTCSKTIYEFEYSSELEVQGAASVSCSGNQGDVIINAVGVELTYVIIEKDGEPFEIDNGSNNIFTGLESATYTVMVYDGCNAAEPLTFNIANLPTTVTATQPEFLDELEACDEGDDDVEVFDLSVQESDIIGTQDPDDVEVTYHATEDDAANGTGALPENYETDTTTIYVRVTYLPNPECYAVTSFEVTVHDKAELTMDAFWGMCEGEEVTITADPGYVKYTWSTGDEGQSITVDETGSYTVTVQDANGCENSFTVEVETSSGPEILNLEVVDWTWYQNSIVVNTMPNPASDNFEYSIDGVNYQQSPVFNNLPAGSYEVSVRDIYGCGYDEETTYILCYPKFFTPNGDGINETWRIQYAMLFEPDLKVYIYDRYGKLLTGFGASSIGWDGTYNGERLPATDYWFVVVRQDGKEYKGHFSMIR